MNPKVRSIIDALPFNSEGYLQAKNILRTKYGKESELINAHVINIMSLPVIQGTNPNKILEFCETLQPNLHANGTALYMAQLFLMPVICKYIWRVEEAGMGGFWETVGMEFSHT